MPTSGGCMRCIVALLAILFARAALAQEDMSARLFGSWRLISFQLKVVGEDTEPKNIFGPNPVGRIIFSPEHRVVVFISRAGRRPPTSESEAAALLSSMTPYTGQFRPAQRLNRQGKCRTGVSVRIIEVIAGHERRPVREDPHKAACRHVFPHHVVGQIRQTKTG